MTKQTPIICWGASGHAKVLREFLPALGYQLIACFDNDARVSSPFSNIPLVGGWEAFPVWRQDHPGPIACIAAIGGDRGRDRLEIQHRLAGAGLHPVSLVHPTAFLADGAVLGSGTQILARSSVCVDVKLGEACIVNTSASVDHECRIGNGVHIAPGATLCGLVVVDDFALVGAGATVMPRVHVGRGAVVGAGAVVTRDVETGTCVTGVPARVRRRKVLG